MSNLPIFDIAIIIVYLLAMVAVGFYFSKRFRTVMGISPKKYRAMNT
jgi:uncharacterized protein YneF (UPF0154 family)